MLPSRATARQSECPLQCDVWMFGSVRAWAKGTWREALNFSSMSRYCAVADSITAFFFLSLASSFCGCALDCE